MIMCGNDYGARRRGASIRGTIVNERPGSRRAARRAVVPSASLAERPARKAAARQAEAERQARGLNNREWWAGQESARKARQAAAERAQ